jgi:hypothetical protein
MLLFFKWLTDEHSYTFLQQGSATVHTTGASMDTLREMFRDGIVSIAFVTNLLPSPQHLFMRNVEEKVYRLAVTQLKISKGKLSLFPKNFNT